MEKIKTEAEYLPRELFQIKLAETGSTITWLARKLEIDRGYLSKVLSGSKPMSPSVRKRINEILGTNF